MTQEQKQLLLKDLCARLPYGVVVDVSRVEEWKQLTLTPFILSNYYDDIEKIKPYLRPMSNMTEEEFKEYHSMLIDVDNSGLMNQKLITKIVDWLDEKIFDHRNLIPKGLALEASKEMYKN